MSSAYPGTMVRHVLDDDAPGPAGPQLVGHLLDGVSEPVLARGFDYWRHIDWRHIDNDLGV